MRLNPLTACDFYKVSHKDQYPAGTTKIYSNLTPRSNRLSPEVQGKKIDKVLVCGIQGFIKNFLIDQFYENFFDRPRSIVLKEYQRRMDSSLGPGSVNIEHIAALYDLGYLPIEIKALPEGELCPMKVPVLTITNTLPEFFWLTNYLETAISASLWKVMTNATYAFEYRKLLTKYAIKTGGNLDFVLWQGHDFSMRGQGGIECSAESGAGHLFSFLGTDTIPAIEYLEDYYRASDEFVGGSVPASEHSVLCAGGQENEQETIRRLIQDIHPTGVVSVISDSWDYWNTITTIATNLKDVIMSRQPNALGLNKVVFRPDSGDPADIICGTVIQEVQNADWAVDILMDKVRSETPHGELGEQNPTGLFRIGNEIYEVSCEIEWNRHDKQYYYIDGVYNIQSKRVQATPQQKGSIEVLWDIFGGTVNEKGYKELDPHVGLIYGDSITLERAQDILSRLEAKGFASTNVVFGIGSFTYQYVTRDTFGFAMKATYAEVNGVGRELFKDPKTDSGTKKSAKGLLRVQNVDNQYVLLDQQTKEEETEGALKTVFKDGVLTVNEKLSTIRARVQYSLDRELEDSV